MRHKHFDYNVKVEWTEGREGWIRAPGRPELRFGSPPEFGGKGGVWTPEDFFVAAVTTCTMTTFLALAERDGVPIASYECDATGLLEYQDGYQFTRVALRPRIAVDDETWVEAVQRLLEKAHDRCLIANSILSTVVIEPEITVSGPVPVPA